MIFKKLHRIIVCLLIFSIGGNMGMAYQEPNIHRKFDDNFKDRYSSNKYNYEGKKVVNKLPIATGDYEDFNTKKPKINEDNNASNILVNLGYFSWLFYIVLFIAVVGLIYILLKEGGSGWFSSKGQTKIDTSVDITSANIETTDIHALIIQAETNQDYRLAIRYYYLLVLKTLSLKNHIKFEDDKTNADYLNATKSKPFSGAFQYTSYVYNYIWYGEFPLNNQQYILAKDTFVTLINQIK